MGNNNGWCQDNELSWFDWSLVEKNRDMLRFVKELIALRRRHPNLNRREFLSGEQVSGRGLPDIAWHGYRLDEPLWSDYSAQYLAYTLAGQSDDEEDLHVVLNMSERNVAASLPEIPGRLWHLALDTSRTDQDDILPRDQQKALESSSYTIARRTVAVFEARG
jgi:glycogen operon protein